MNARKSLSAVAEHAQLHIHMHTQYTAAAHLHTHLRAHTPTDMSHAHTDLGTDSIHEYAYRYTGQKREVSRNIIIRIVGWAMLFELVPLINNFFFSISS